MSLKKLFEVKLQCETQATDFMFLELDDILSRHFSFFIANNVEALIYEVTVGRNNGSE